VDWRYDLFSLGSQRRIQSLFLQPEIEGHQTTHRSQRLSGDGSIGGRRTDSLRASRLPPRLRPKVIAIHKADDRCFRRSRRNPSTIREGRALHPRRLDIADGARAVFEFRGEIITVPAEKGDARNLTNTTGAHERYPVWSPDGKSIAYFSDESGEYELHVRNQDGKGEVRKIKVSGAGFYDVPVWSPDSQKISYADNSWSLFWLDLKTGASKKIASEYQYGPSRARTIHHVWSPDSKWIAYTLNSKAYIQAVHAYSIEKDKSSQITDGLSEVSEPVFDESGKYLYFFGSTDAGPVKDWFAMSNADMRVTQSLYLAVLRNNLPNPLAKESDEEKGLQKEEKPKEPPKTAPEPFSIDFEGIENRILAIPLPPGNYRELAAGAAGQFYYIEVPAGDAPFGGPDRSSLHLYDLNKRKDEVFIPGVRGYLVSADKKKILYTGNNAWSIVAVTPKPQPAAGKINVDDIEVRIDPRVEWTQIFNEAWRINRDYFTRQICTALIGVRRAKVCCVSPHPPPAAT
jgi:tricorn protease